MSLLLSMVFWILFQKITRDYSYKVMLSEKDFINKFIKPLGKNNKNSFGFNDDVAVVNNYAYSTDTIVEGIHFFKDDNPKFIAKKLIRVNVSDLIAKGVKPKYCLLNFSSGKSINTKWIKDFTNSFGKDLEKYNLSLIGGDTVVTKSKIVLSITIFGKINSKKIKLRSAAKSSDLIYVSGTIGDSAVGLKILNKKIEFDKKSEKILISRFHVPQPEVNLVQLINKKANASTDISDGLINDLNNICEFSKLGAEIEFSLIPKSKEVKKFLKNFKNYEKLILNGGDDYQILFTGPDGLDSQANVTKIGRMTKNKGIKIIDKNFNNLLKGYNHSIC